MGERWVEKKRKEREQRRISERKEGMKVGETDDREEKRSRENEWRSN